MNNPSCLIVIPVFKDAWPLHWCLKSVVQVLNTASTISAVALDNGSDSEVQAMLKTWAHPNLKIHRFDTNIGKAPAINRYLTEHYTLNTLPDTVVSLDSDISFRTESLLKLIQAVHDVPKLSMLSMRYVKNICNPEKNLYLPSKTWKGTHNQVFHVKHPILCNVAGGIIALSKKAFETLGLAIYPPHPDVNKTYYPDDAFLYDSLKKKGFKPGYLNGTLAMHWKSGPHYLYTPNDAFEPYESIAFPLTL